MCLFLHKLFSLIQLQLDQYNITNDSANSSRSEFYHFLANVTLGKVVVIFAKPHLPHL